MTELTQKNINHCLKWFEDLKNHLKNNEKEIAKNLLKEIIDRLNFLDKVGLEYLTLSILILSLNSNKCYTPSLYMSVIHFIK